MHKTPLLSIFLCSFVATATFGYEVQIRNNVKNHRALYDISTIQQLITISNPIKEQVTEIIKNAECKLVVFEGRANIKELQDYTKNFEYIDVKKDLYNIQTSLYENLSNSQVEESWIPMLVGNTHVFEQLILVHEIYKNMTGLFFLKVKTKEKSTIDKVIEVVKTSLKNAKQEVHNIIHDFYFVLKIIFIIFCFYSFFLIPCIIINCVVNKTKTV
eukprot:TRINITY_DN14394_c0_g1_i1.p1 TRINITY_DN14394_c0_g1~~TRINITY_DN14394_c0_g1_i1.p1  ORF type:complete len:215 (-),score=10.14 TRINITY_DN14394_c0_g1_i1:52-696(-)